MNSVCLIPARSGSQRVKNKNIRLLNQHPLIAYTISCAIKSRCFEKVIVSTDSEQIANIALHYGAEVPFIRPEELAGTNSPDIEWVKHALSFLSYGFDSFSILRPTSPFRTPATIQRAFKNFNDKSNKIDSIRAVTLSREHPFKMWSIRKDGLLMEPLFQAPDDEVPYHSRQYQSLPKIYVQDSSLEIAHTRVVKDENSISGRCIAPFLTQGFEGFSIDYESEWLEAENHIKDNNQDYLIDTPAYKA